MTQRGVLHLIHTGGAGGAETVMQQLVKHVDPDRWRSVAVVPCEGWLLSALRETAVEDVVVQPGSGSFDLRLLQRLIQVARTHRVDLIHTHLFGPAVYGSAAGRILRLPVVSTIHGVVDLAIADKWWGMKKRLLRGPRNRFVAVTESLRTIMLRQLGVPADRTQVIVNGIDVAWFAPARVRNLRRELGWTGDEVLVGAVGNVRKPKGYPNLLEAAAFLRERCPRCRFVIIGDTAGEPALYRDLLARRDELHLQDRVVFTGFRDDVNEALNNLDLFVMSSTREGLPLAILQAMAVKLPIVATRCGGPQEVLTHERDALLVPVGEPKALAEGIQRLVENRVKADRLAAAAYETVRARFTLERMAQAYQEVYAACLAPAARQVTL